MKKLICIVLFLGLAVMAQAKEYTAEEILKQSDQTRNAWNSFLIRLKISNYKNEQVKNENEFEVYIKDNDKTLVKFLGADVKGQYVLMLEDNMWIYMPDTHKPIRITPLQKLMGDASNGDVARTNYSYDYSPVITGEETIDNEICYKLELSAKREGATYHKIIYWVTKDGLLPRKADFYLASGKHYKTAIFTEYREVDQQNLLSKMVLIDQLHPGQKTIMDYQEFIPQEIPEKFFSKNYMDKLR